MQEVPLDGGICDLLWSDPEEDTTGWRVSSRGCGYLFGGDVVSKVDCGWMRLGVVQRGQQPDADLPVTPDGDGGVQVDVQQPAGGRVVGSELLLPLRQHSVDYGGGRVLAEHIQNVRRCSAQRAEGALEEPSSGLFPVACLLSCAMSSQFERCSVHRSQQMVLKTSQQMVLKTVVVASTNPCKVEACRLAFVALRYEKLMSRRRCSRKTHSVSFPCPRRAESATSPTVRKKQDKVNNRRDGVRNRRDQSCDGCTEKARRDARLCGGFGGRVKNAR